MQSAASKSPAGYDNESPSLIDARLRSPTLSLEVDHRNTGVEADGVGACAQKSFGREPRATRRLKDAQALDGTARPVPQAGHGGRCTRRRRRGLPITSLTSLTSQADHNPVLSMALVEKTPRIYCPTGLTCPLFGMSVSIPVPSRSADSASRPGRSVVALLRNPHGSAAGRWWCGGGGVRTSPAAGAWR